MMTFAIKHNITEARALIFERQGKYKDSIRQHLRDGHALEALQVALGHVTEIRWHRDMFNAVTEEFLESLSARSIHYSMQFHAGLLKIGNAMR
jgi:hypothetical protein